MIIGDQLGALREQHNLSQGDIEKRTGLLRCYVSRVENGHTVPSIATLEKWARALGVPLYQVFSAAETPAQLTILGCGVPQAETRVFWVSCGGRSAIRASATANCCCTWRGNWRNSGWPLSRT